MFRQAEIFPIVITTKTEAYEVRYELSENGVVFLPVDRKESPELFESVKLGFSFLQDKSEKIVFVPVNVLFFHLIHYNN